MCTDEWRCHSLSKTIYIYEPKKSANLAQFYINAFSSYFNSVMSDRISNTEKESINFS